MASARHNRKRKHGRRRMGLLFKLLCGAALAVEDTVQTRGEQAAGIMDLTQEEYDAAFTPASG